MDLVMAEIPTIYKFRAAEVRCPVYQTSPTRQSPTISPVTDQPHVHAALSMSPVVIRERSCEGVVEERTNVM